MSLPGEGIGALREQLKGSKADIFILGQDGYDDLIKRFSDAAEKRAVSIRHLT
jgi:hypothetical protein